MIIIIIIITTLIYKYTHIHPHTHTQKTMDNRNNNKPPVPPPSSEQYQLQQQRAAKVLAALEKQISERIDKDFFAEEVVFRYVGVCMYVWRGRGRGGGMYVLQGRVGEMGEGVCACLSVCMYIASI
jgi:hypothetical protein